MITYNGIPKAVITQAFRVKRETANVTQFNYLTIVGAASIMDVPELREWVSNHPKDGQLLLDAMNAYVSGQEPD